MIKETGKLFVYKNDYASYPNDKFYWSPGEKYPEYKRDVVSDEKNDVYEGIRNAFYSLGWDNDNYGTEKWNPLGEFIKKESKVLIKPNFVSHKNPTGDIECLTTHVSIIRAVLDYVLIALDGTGEVIVGDAPIQSCDFEQLMTNGNYEKLQEFYHSQGEIIRIIDFRGTTTKRGEKGELHQTKTSRGREKAVRVNIGKDSAHYGQSKENKLRITNYTPESLTKHHFQDTHEYLIDADVLDADVIINLPKPKTHRKAGMTGALKNMIGVNVEKEYLPHHKQGSVQTGGDEYPTASFSKALISHLNISKDRKSIEKEYRWMPFLNGAVRIINVLRKPALIINKRADIKEGSWSGNDTIWRTICDVNRIVRYSNKRGELEPTIQRKVITIADMITAGVGEGPLMPSPLHMGCIVVGSNAVDVDRAIASLMGFKKEMIPSINNATFGERYLLCTDEPIIKSNRKELNDIPMYELEMFNYPRVKMPTGWQ